MPHNKVPHSDGNSAAQNLDLRVRLVASSVAGLFMLRVANYVLLLCTYDNLIVMASSSTPCNSSKSISGERQILVLLDTHQTLDFRQSERKVRIQAIIFMSHVFAS